MKFNHVAAPITYICGSLQKYKKSYGKSCPASLLKPSFRPPPCFCLVIGGGCFPIFAGENKYSGLGIPANKFSGRACSENKLSIATKFASPPPPQNQMVAPLRLLWHLLLYFVRVNDYILSVEIRLM